VRKCSLIVAWLGVSACGSSPDPAADAGPSFVAYTASFEGYHAWQSWSFTDPAVPASPHTSGPRTVHLNHEPPHGSVEFPVGTIIVKDIGPGPASADTTFAMVKRGGGFNAEGAPGWEWFELQNHTDGSVTILWRGAAPPAGQAYSGDPTACNTCHFTSKFNDYVQSPPLRLTNF
jgi:hypothetical protein